MSIITEFETLPHSRGSLELEFSEDRIATLWLDNPDARNAMSIAMMHQLPSILEVLQQQTPSLLIVRGRNGHFCAGGDLEDVKSHLLTPELGAEMCRFMTTHTNALCTLPCMIVVVLEGAAIGGGAELVTISDYVIADAESKIGFLQTRLGVTTGWGGGQRLIKRIGKTKAVQVLGLSRVYSAQQAKGIGLIDEVTSSVEESVSILKSRILKQPPQAFTRLMTWLHRTNENTTELDTFASTWAGAEHCNALGIDQLQKET